MTNDTIRIAAYVNSIIIGHVLTYFAFFLNVAEHSKIGAALAVLTLVTSYFHEGYCAAGWKVDASRMLALRYGGMATLALSYFIYLI